MPRMTVGCIVDAVVPDGIPYPQAEDAVTKGARDALEAMGADISDIRIGWVSSLGGAVPDEGFRVLVALANALDGPTPYRSASRERRFMRALVQELLYSGRARREFVDSGGLIGIRTTFDGSEVRIGGIRDESDRGHREGRGDHGGLVHVLGRGRGADGGSAIHRGPGQDQHAAMHDDGDIHPP